jgi:hypothetical protein
MDKQTLAQAVIYGRMKAGDTAKFLGWKKLPEKERIMMGRWSDGTIVYRRRKVVHVVDPPES